jgi:hypothetical protein
MSVNFHIDKEHDLLVAKVSGVVTADDIITATDKVIRDSRGAGFYKNHLFELEPDSVLSLLDLNGLLRLRRFLEELGKKYPGRNVRTVFLVTDRHVQAGTVEVWRAVAREASNFKVDIRIMTDRAQALAWLKEPKA